MKKKKFISKKNNNNNKTLIRLAITFILLLIIIKGLIAISYCNDNEVNAPFNSYITAYTSDENKLKFQESDDYYKFSDIKIKDVFSKYKKNEIKSNKHVILYKEDNQYDYVIMRKFNTTYKELKSDKIVFKNDGKLIDDKFYTKEVHNYLEKNNITNQEDLNNLLFNGLDVNIFTSIKDIKAICSIKKYISLSVPYVEKMEKISGNIDGLFIKYTDNLYAVEFYKGDYKYIISFGVNDNIPSKKYILDLVSTIK